MPRPRPRAWPGVKTATSILSRSFARGLAGGETCAELGIGVAAEVAFAIDQEDGRPLKQQLLEDREGKGGLSAAAAAEDGDVALQVLRVEVDGERSEGAGGAM